MQNLSIVLNYIYVIMLAVFTLNIMVTYKLSTDEKKASLTMEQIILFAMCFLGHGYILFNNAVDQKGLTILGLNVIAIGLFVYGSQLSHYLEPIVWHVIAMLHLIGSIMLHRLDPDLALKHTLFACVGFLVMVGVLAIVRRMKKMDKLTWVYIILSVALLFSVNATVNGATNWVNIRGITFQPSEIVKILFAFSLAAIFHSQKNFLGLVKGSMYSGMLILILVYQRDLGSALLFFVTYIVLSYMYYQKRWLPFAQIGVLSVASVVAYQLFSHIQVRIISWLYPFNYIDREGYQITQSLFAFARGKWMGTGLMQGMPKRIPVVNSDFIFAAIGEELGSFFVLLTIFLFYMLIIMLLAQCQKSKRRFFLYAGVGMTVMLGFQGFLIIGGVIKLVPLTGVTFPFVSYGGTSLLTSIGMVGCIDLMSKLPCRKEKYSYNAHTLISLKVVMTILYMALIGYFMFFIVVQSEDVQLNSYNKRLEFIEKEIIRGSIYDSTGEVLAYTKVEGDTQQRIYPFGNSYAHVVGYTNPGKTGIEADLNMQLLDSNQNFLQQLLRNVKAQERRGSDIHLTLNHTLQQIADTSLGNRKGAVVAMDPTTGKILAMVSKPDFDPNVLYQTYGQLSTDAKEATLLNRVTNGLYPPGSTFKALTALTYIREHSEPFSYVCKGAHQFAEKTIHCYGDTAHGEVSIKEAFAYSCNTAFAVMGEAVTTEQLEETANDLFFNQALPYAYNHKRSQFGFPEYVSAALRAETVIGQGETMITPLHNLIITSAIANGGLIVEPYLVDYIENPNGKIVEQTLPNGYETTLTVDEIKALREYMVATVTMGTGKKLRSDHYSAAGKTGAAENPFGATHAWFVGFAPAQEPQIAVSILVENAGSSGANAVPIAKELFDAYLLN